MFRELHRDCTDLFFVAQRSRRIAGYMVTCRSAKKAEIVSVAVDPALRRLGVGSGLIRHTLAELCRYGLRQVELMVRTTSEDAARLYRSLGFTHVRRVRRYYEDGGDAFRMRKVLAGAKAGRRQA
jgi:ribosomal protein S18 acetylase RimI-like enzyme